MGNTEQNSVDSQVIPPEAVEKPDLPTGESEQGPADQENAADVAAADVEELKIKLASAEEKAKDSLDQVLRARAEAENVRRRMERDLEKAHKYALEGFAQELLTVTDSLELGLSAASEENASIDKLIEGTDLTLKMLKTAMEKFNIKEVDPIGQAFNPELHQAMTMQVSADHAANTVITVFQKGYLLNDRLIRPARVVVSQLPPEEKVEPEGDPEEVKLGGNIDEQA